MTKEEFIESMVESSWEDYKFVNQVLYEFYENQVKDMSNIEFKEYLKELGYE